jgi:hypothetical protein
MHTLRSCLAFLLLFLPTLACAQDQTQPQPQVEPLTLAADTQPPILPDLEVDLGRPPILPEIEALAPISSSCEIGTVLPHVTSHVREFVENVNRFTAREALERERLTRDGKIREQYRSHSNYVAAIENRDGFFVVEEYRNQTSGDVSVKGTISANIAPALELVFHPNHIDEYAMTCEGPLDWDGRQTWRIRFEQRLDRPATISSFVANHKVFTVLMKGSAWVDTHSFQLVHLEADLLSPISDIRLESLHQTVDYGPVTFAQRKTTLWLPTQADITADFQGKLLVERHKYSSFQLFSVDTGQKIAKPADPPQPLSK